jgi:hypothetical protein
MIAATPERPFSDAAICVDPGPTPVTTPAWLTVATCGFCVDQNTGVGPRSSPVAPKTRAVSVMVRPAGTLACAGSTSMRLMEGELASTA